VTRLSVNLNKVALLRNARGGTEPSVLEAARAVLQTGAAGITLHPRPDLRHARPDDLRALAGLLGDAAELNIEGNPFAPANVQGYPGLLALVRETRPAQCTLVPDANDQLTSDHGFDLGRDSVALAALVDQLKRAGCRVSLFVDAGVADLERARALGADRIEIYTGPYAEAFKSGKPDEALALCRDTALRAQAAGLGVNAGHDLNQQNLLPFLRAVPGVLEVSIGHALIGESLYQGLAQTVRAYLEIIAQAPGT